MFDVNRLPDVARQKENNIPHSLQWVGMENISLPIQIEQSDHALQTVQSKVNVFVNLDDNKAKGIHMSRLYLNVKDNLAHKAISHAHLLPVLSSMISSQEGLSTAAKLSFHFDLTLVKSSLKSNLEGYQSYPVIYTISQHQDKIKQTLEFSVAYSSTCPCSASLSRQALADVIDRNFAETFIDKEQFLSWIKSEQGSVATPHSQRSYVTLKLDISGTSAPDIEKHIRKVEAIISTPVQTAVKREDEQAFAQLNGENLMFCEDAARKIKTYLEAEEQLDNYWFKIDHQESLHAHNAVVTDQKSPWTDL